MARQFVTLFWGHVPDTELETRSAEALADAAMALWEFATDRVPGRPTIAVDVGRTPPVVRVVNDDMPFLVDSTIAALNGLGLTVRLLIHPIATVHREAGRLVSLGDHPLAFKELMMHIEVDRLPSDRADEVRTRLAEVLSNVRAVVLDWPEMRGAALRLASGITSGAAPVPMAEASEASAFLHWLADDNFVFIGLRDYCFADDEIDVVAGSGRGLLRDDNYRVLDGLRQIVRSSPEIQAFLHSPRLTTIAKSSRRSPVHRPALMDTIGIKTFDTDGRPSGIRLMAGLFTSESYSSSPRTIPILRHKVKRCVEWAGFPPGSHDARALQHILDALPRDDLFQSDERTLFELALGVLYLQQPSARGAVHVARPVRARDHLSGLRAARTLRRGRAAPHGGYPGTRLRRQAGCRRSSIGRQRARARAFPDRHASRSDQAAGSRGAGAGTHAGVAHLARPA